MPLLQIAEPGMSEVPHSVHLAVGIDLGTTNSLVATVKNGEAVVLEDEKGSALLPSVVRYLAARCRSDARRFSARPKTRRIRFPVRSG